MLYPAEGEKAIVSILAMKRRLNFIASCSCAIAEIGHKKQAA
jgi:hypothetical protein